MIPIGDENPNSLSPYVTYSLVGVNALVWILIQGAGFSGSLEQSVCQFGLIPAHLSDTGHSNTCPPSTVSAFLTIFTSMFMHGGWMHILGNMLFLWVFGDNVEDSMGHFRFLVFYLLGGLGAALAQVWTEPSSGIPMVGASGAIGAVMGAYLMLYPRAKVVIAVFIIVIFTTYRVPAFLMLGYWIGVQFVSAISTDSAGGGVAFWAHVGGFITGAVLVMFFRDEELMTDNKCSGWTADEIVERDIWRNPDNQQ